MPTARPLTAAEIATERPYVASATPLTLPPGVSFLFGARGVGLSTELVRQCIVHARGTTIWHVTPRLPQGDVATWAGQVLLAITRALGDTATARQIRLPRRSGSAETTAAIADLALVAGALAREGAWLGIDLQHVPVAHVSAVCRGLAIALPPLGAGVALPPGSEPEMAPRVRWMVPDPDVELARRILSRHAQPPRAAPVRPGIAPGPRTPRLRLPVEVLDLLAEAADGLPGTLVALLQDVLGRAARQGRRVPTARDAQAAVAAAVAATAARITPEDEGHLVRAGRDPWACWPYVARGLVLPGRGITHLARRALSQRAAETWPAR